MKSVTLSSKYQIVIPRAVRSKLGLQRGDRLIIDQVTSTEIVLKKEPSYFDLIGTLPTGNDDPVARVRKLRSSWK